MKNDLSNQVSYTHEKSKQIALARLDIVNQWLEFRKKSKNKLQADYDFVKLHNTKEVITILGLLEAIGYLKFEANGGLNSQIYIHVNETKTMQQVINKPEYYKNKLLEKINERHKTSVAMLSFLYQNKFKSDEIWNYIENYFLGIMPSELNI